MQHWWLIYDSWEKRERASTFYSHRYPAISSSIVCGDDNSWYVLGIHPHFLQLSAPISSYESSWYHTYMPQPLRRTYAVLSLDTAQLSPVPAVLSSVPAPVLSPPLTRTALQPIIKHPTTTSSPWFYFPRHSSLLGPHRPRQLHLRHSLHPDNQIIPPFKPKRNLYRKVLKKEFLRATSPKKVTMETSTTDDQITTDDNWPVAV